MFHAIVRETVSIEPGESEAGAEPQKSERILHNAEGSVVREAVRRGVDADWQLAARRRQ